jgi:hypothetical protein
MKFAGHRNSKTLVGHYLDNMSNVDSAAAFLTLKPRQDLTEDFCSASIKRDPNLRHSLPTKNQEELKQRWDYINLLEQIKDLSGQVMAATTEEACKELTARQHYLYKQQQKLINKELANYYRTKQWVHTTQCEVDDQGKWHCSYFKREKCDEIVGAVAIISEPSALAMKTPDKVGQLRV